MSSFRRQHLQSRPSSRRSPPNSTGPMPARSNPLRHYPLLLMTDQEGGLVRRLPAHRRQSEKQIGEAARPAAGGPGRGPGRGPESDRGRPEREPGAGARRVPDAGRLRRPVRPLLQHQPAQVSYLGADFIKAQQATGVAATAKHFPGLGAAATAQNTDEEPVTLNVPLAHPARHRRVSLPGRHPGRGQAGHGVVGGLPGTGPGQPAGLSSRVVGGELRQRLGFTGVTITDALEAGALKAYGTPGTGPR